MSTQVLLFEKPMFQGECIEIEKDIYNFDEGEEEKTEEDETESPDSTRRKRLSSVGSLKILSGLWVIVFYSTATLSDLVFLFWSQILERQPDHQHVTLDLHIP